MKPIRLFADAALLPEGWAERGGVDGDDGSQAGGRVIGEDDLLVLRTDLEDVDRGAGHVMTAFCLSAATRVGGGGRVAAWVARPAYPG